MTPLDPRRHARAAWAAVRHHKHNLPRHLGELTIRVAINRNAEALHDASNLPNDARDGESHSRSASMSRATGRNQTSERKAMAKKRAPNGEYGTKVLRLAKETASRRLR